MTSKITLPDGTTVEDRLLNTAEFAAREDITYGHACNMRSKGTGPAYLKLNSAVKYRLQDILAWEQSKRVATADSE